MTFIICNGVSSSFRLPFMYFFKIVSMLRYCSFRRKSMIKKSKHSDVEHKNLNYVQTRIMFFMFSRIGYSKEKFSVECAVDCFPPKLFWHLCDNMNVKLHSFDAPTKIPPRFSYSHLWIFCFQRYHHSFIGIRPSESFNIISVMYYNW